MYEEFIKKIKNSGGWNYIRHIPPDFWSEKKLQNFFLALEEERKGILEVKSVPYHIVVEPTNICNLRCALCSTGLGNKSRSKGRMDLNHFKELIDECYQTTLELYLQNWGESTLVSYLPAMIKYAADKGIWVHLSTNFSLEHSDDFLERLVHSGLAMLHCDIDGTTQAVYEKYRAGGNLNLVLENIRKCVGIKMLHGLKYPLIEGTMLVMKHNEHQINLFNQLAEELGLDQWSFGRIQLDPNMKKEEWLPQAEEHKYATYAGADTGRRPHCHWLWSGLVINWDGGVSPCCIIDDKKADFTNIFAEGGIKNVWNHSKFISARAEFFDWSKIISPNICNICKNQTHRPDIRRFPNTYSLMLDESKLSNKENNSNNLDNFNGPNNHNNHNSPNNHNNYNSYNSYNSEDKLSFKEIPWAKLYIDEQEMNEAVDCLKSGWMGKGPRVDQFEEKVKFLTGVKHCIAVNSGTAALDVALKVLEIKPGDEVIVPAMAYIATANSVLYQQAIPVFADINSETFTIDPVDAARKITEKTKVIIAIDYAGQSADYAALRKIVAGRSIFIVEDAAPSFGGECQGKKLCSLGDIGITSFHIAKSFTAVEGGMLFTDNDKYAEKARIILNQGESPHRKYFHPYLGHNYRLSDLHAAIGLVQVSRFKEVLAKRAYLAERYSQEIGRQTHLIKTPLVLPGNKHAWFLYPVIIEGNMSRDLVFRKLKEKGISANVSWPMPVYDQPYFQKYLRERCPTADNITKKILCLPMYYSMSEEEQDYVIRNLVEMVNTDIKYKNIN